MLVGPDENIIIVMLLLIKYASLNFITIEAINNLFHTNTIKK
jgi:hypothetical protein